MPKSCNLSKLRNLSTSSPQNNIKQTTISKFFQSKPVIKNESTFDKLLTATGTESGQKEKITGKRDSSSLNLLGNPKEIGIKKLKTESSSPSGIAVSTLEKLNSFSSSAPPGDQRNFKDLEPALNPDVPNNNDCEEYNGESSEEENTAKQKTCKTRGKHSNKDKDSKTTFTPLEKQFMKIKENHPDAILFVECGYKYRFFGEDAEIAAKELNIFCHMDHNFQTASIPTHRLFVHVRRLIAKGYKVGIVKQTETAALKASGNNRNAPFDRELTALYTKSTLIEEDIVPLENSEDALEVSPEWQQNQCLLVLCEHIQDRGNSNKVPVGLLAMYPDTGRIKYDFFEMSGTRQDLDARLTQLHPTEILLPKTAVTSQTEKLIEHWSAKRVTDEDRLRLERIDDETFNYASAIVVVSSFFEQQLEDEGNVNEKKIADLPPPVISCLAVLIVYLKEFKLERILLSASQFITKLSPDQRCMSLDASTIRNLEIFYNLMDGKVSGSLFWVLNHTLTKFGARLLRNWVMQPLCDIKAIDERQEAITELLSNADTVWTDIRKVFQKLPDVEKGLGSIFHYKCSTAMFYCVVNGLSTVANKLQGTFEYLKAQYSSAYLKNLISTIISSLNDVDSFLKNINERAAREGNKTKIFHDWTSFPDVVKTQLEIQETIDKLKKLKKPIRDVLRLPAFEYTSVSGQEYLIEVKRSQMKAVPKEWISINFTKQVCRLRSPEVHALVQELNQLRETLTNHCTEAWIAFLGKFNCNFYRYSQAIENIATLDCLFSLVEVAKQPGYCRPFMMEHSQVIHIEGGRHPILSLMMSEEKQYVPNNTELEANSKRCMIITGPNMGGKSSYIRQVGLIVILAHVGSYVPADAATLSLIDGIYTRMGSADDLYKGRSTFMVEMEDTCHIMQKATSKSLVILDELGRGTSTHDGVAIAQAALNYFLTEVKCLTMFVTHYTILTEFENRFDHVANYHMSFIVDESEEDSADDPSKLQNIVFMYHLTHGKAGRSYGLNVARLANLPLELLKTAKIKSEQMEERINQKRLLNTLRKVWKSSPEKLSDILEL